MYEHDIVETYNQLTLDGTMTVWRLHVAEHMALHSMDFLLYLKLPLDTFVGHMDNVEVGQCQKTQKQNHVE